MRRWRSEGAKEGSKVGKEGGKEREKKGRKGKEGVSEGEESNSKIETQRTGKLRICICVCTCNVPCILNACGADCMVRGLYRARSGSTNRVK